MRSCVRLGAVALVGVFGVAHAAPALPTNPSVVSGSATNQSGLFTAGESGAELMLPSGARLGLSPNGVMRVFGKPQKLELERGGKTPTWSLSLLHGRLDISVPAKQRNAVLATVDKVSAVVLAGHASVVADTGSTLVINASGSVRTFIDNRWANVDAGHLSRIDAEHPAGVAEALLPAPELKRASRVWFSAGEPVTLAGFEWQAVERASAYQIELRDGDTLLGSARENTTRLEHELARLGPGEYAFQLRALDARGIEGAWSAPLTLRVVGVELPPGAYVENGGIFLGGGQKVHFSHTGGLEMTYLGAGKYISASEEVGLYRNARTVISFRYPNTLDNAIARLEPRDVYAEVTAGPKKAVWPRDAVELTVRMRTRSGDAVPAFIEAVPKVLLGVEPLNVEWRRVGDELTARVLPSATPGPWVIRVDVSDQFGIPLGRDFVEVAEQAGKSTSHRAPALADRAFKASGADARALASDAPIAAKGR